MSGLNVAFISFYLGALRKLLQGDNHYHNVDSQSIVSFIIDTQIIPKDSDMRTNKN